MKIERLEIFTSDLEKQRHFYRQVLGLPILNETLNNIQVQVGYSLLKIEQRPNSKPYHIAFHIPAFMEEEGLEWLKARVSIIKDGEDEIVDFPAWKARSVYFYDSDQNILELISRRHCFSTEGKSFGPRSWQGISEIGLATSKVQESFDFLNSHFGLQKFTGDYNVFCATGDDEGLFIVVDKNRKEWFPSNDPALASDFRIWISREGQQPEGLEYKNERLQLL